MWENTGHLAPYPEGAYDMNPNIRPFAYPPIPSQVETSGVYRPRYMNLESANAYLRSGYYAGSVTDSETDYRLQSGEYLILIRLEDGVPAPKSMVKVLSRSYSWRLSLRDENPNLLHRFFELTDEARLGNSKDNGALYTAFLERFPTFDRMTSKELSKAVENSPKELLFPLTKTITEAEFRNENNRLMQVWLNYFFAAPLQQREEIIPFLSKYLQTRRDLIRFVQKKAPSCRRGNTEMDPSVTSLIYRARAYARSQANIGSRKSCDALTNEGIASTIPLLSGFDQYRLLKAKKCEERVRSKKDERERQGLPFTPPNNRIRSSRPRFRTWRPQDEEETTSDV